MLYATIMNISNMTFNIFIEHKSVWCIDDNWCDWHECDFDCSKWLAWSLPRMESKTCVGQRTIRSELDFDIEPPKYSYYRLSIRF